jgi:hypothetical protein
MRKASPPDFRADLSEPMTNSAVFSEKFAAALGLAQSIAVRPDIAPLPSGGLLAPIVPAVFERGCELLGQDAAITAAD